MTGVQTCALPIYLQGMLSGEDIFRLKSGLKTKTEKYAPAKVSIKQKDYTRDRMIVELTIHEGKNHQVKNMMEALGHQVRRLHRSRFGTISDEGLRPGEYRRLKPYEIKQLTAMSDNEGDDKK